MPRSATRDSGGATRGVASTADAAAVDLHLSSTVSASPPDSRLLVLCSVLAPAGRGNSDKYDSGAPPLAVAGTAAQIPAEIGRGCLHGPLNTELHTCGSCSVQQQLRLGRHHNRIEENTRLRTCSGRGQQPPPAVYGLGGGGVRGMRAARATCTQNRYLGLHI